MRKVHYLFLLFMIFYDKIQFESQRPLGKGWIECVAKLLIQLLAERGLRWDRSEDLMCTEACIDVL